MGGCSRYSDYGDDGDASCWWWWCWPVVIVIGGCDSDYDYGDIYAVNGGGVNDGDDKDSNDWYMGPLMVVVQRYASDDGGDDNDW